MFYWDEILSLKNAQSFLGMDLEGIYRKPGGNSQVKMIQEGFERSDDYDISDPALDITAVTSVLKQYLRKLPTPLLTFEAYDGILEASGELSLIQLCGRNTASSHIFLSL